MSGTENFERLLLSFWRQGPAREPADAWLARRVAWIEPLRDAGVFSEELAARWIDRFAAAAADDGAPISGYEDSAARVLQDALEAVPAGSEPGGEAVIRFGGTYSALRALNLAGLPDNRELLSRLSRHLAPPPPPSPEREAALAHRGRTAEAVTQASFAELRRVIPGPRTRRGGLCITSVELYDGAGTLCWNLVSEGDTPSGPPLREVGVCDDVGTNYTVFSGSSSLLNGSSGRETYTYAGEANFVPVPPAGAGELFVNHQADRFDIPLEPAG